MPTSADKCSAVNARARATRLADSISLARLNCVQHALDASAAGPVIVLPPLAQRFEKQVDGRAHPQKSEAVVVDDVIVVAAAAAAAAVEA